VQRGKELVVYLSMGFGNPYGDPWSETIVLDWAHQIASLGITTLSLADTVGLATASQVETVTGLLIREFPGLTIGVHLHATPGNWREKVKAAYSAGCRRFDGALKGIGGCPMAGDALVGNLDTLNLIDFCHQEKIPLTLNETALEAATRLANQIFSANH
jgi:hydroxymethylglutaryl-CoA lyase